jgi:AcrR family transcriptional regulator
MNTQGPTNPKTEERLQAAAEALFSRKWYGTVSAAEICRAAGLSNGIFYRYFQGKEALFKVILERVLDQIKRAVEDVKGATPRERTSNLADIILNFSTDHSDLTSVFREGQYRYLEYERRLVSIYMRGLSAALGKEIGLGEYLFAMGGLRFCATRRAFNGIAIHFPTALTILQGGLFPGLGFDPAKVFGGTATPLPVALQEGARERLLQSGHRLFGEKGFFETKIHEVTDGAELSVGAFYTHFESKETFYAELIKVVGHDVRAFISRNLATPATGPLNALEYELRGLWLWLFYLAQDKYCNLVREAEFVLPSSVGGYYEKFIAGYRRRPPELRVVQPASGLDEGTAIEYLLGLAHYFSIETAFEDSPRNARALVETIGGYLTHGLSEFLGNQS